MEEFTIENLSATLEAILFASGEPVSTARISEALEIPAVQIEGTLSRLAEEYASHSSGICIQKLGSTWQMSTQPVYAPMIKRVMETKKMTPLSAAAMEVLTIIAYNQPVSKSFVEHVRGVDSSSVVNTLVEKELLTEGGRLDVPGHPIAYVTTPHFLRCFGLSSLDDLPPIPALRMEEPEPLSEEVEQLPVDPEKLSQ